MTSSRLNASTSNLARWVSRLALAGLALLVVAFPAISEAKRRVVILDFEGPKAEAFHADVERLVKKSAQVIPVSKWNAAAEEMDATSLSKADVKKVAKRLNIDGVISGKIEKRRDEYIVRLKVREGKSGEVVGNPIDTKASGPRLDGSATRELKAELFDTIDLLDTGGGGGGDDEDEEASEDEEDRPRKFSRRGSASEDEEEEEETKPTKGAKGAKGKPVAEEEEEEEIKPTKGTKGAKGKPVAEEEEEEEIKPTKGTKGAKGKPVAEEEPVAEIKPTKGAKGKPVAEEEPVAEIKPTKGAKGKPETVPVATTKGSGETTKPTVTKGESEGTKGKDPDLFAGVSKGEGDGDDDSPFEPKTKPKTKAKPKAKAKPTAVAEDDGGDDDEGSVSDSFSPVTGAVALNHANRAIDVTGGLSFNMRRLRYTFSDLAAGVSGPRNYDSVPNAGFTVDLEAYPLAIGHKSKGPLPNIGVTGAFDRTFLIRTRLRYTDPDTGMSREKELRSTYQRFSIGAVYRHNLGSPEKPLVVTGGLRYSSQVFEVDPDNVPAAIVDLPAVNYKALMPSAGIKLGLGSKMAIGAEVGTMLALSAGEIQNDDKYGAATMTGFEGELFLDYMITGNIFARAVVRAETVGLSFKGYGMLSTMRDGDPDQEVKSARDSYFGGTLTAGYAF